MMRPSGKVKCGVYMWMLAYLPAGAEQALRQLPDVKIVPAGE
jgi:hypothetical protein